MISLFSLSPLLPLSLFLAFAPQNGPTTVTTTTTVTHAADPLVNVTADGTGRVNYGAGVVKATGSGAPPADGTTSNPVQARLMSLGAAKADALRNLAMAVASVQVTSDTRVKNFQTDSDVVETHVEALLKSARVIREEIAKDGTATVTMELPLYGANSVAAAVLPDVLKPAGDWQGPDKPAVALPPATARPPLVDVRDAGLTPASDLGPFTSVIVDCRGLGIEAAMAPKLMEDGGKEVYGTVRVDPDYAIAVGIVGYPRSMGEALRGSRAGAHPLIVRATGAADRHRFNPTVSERDGERILEANGRDHFLERTSVVFLVDPVR